MAHQLLVISLEKGGFESNARGFVGFVTQITNRSDPAWVHREGFRVEFLRSIGFSRGVVHVPTLQVQFGFVTAQIDDGRFDVNPDFRCVAVRQSILVLSH